MNKFYREKYVDSAEDFNKILEWNLPGANVKREGQKANLTNDVILSVSERFVKFTCKYSKMNKDGSISESSNWPCTWFFDLTGENCIPVNPLSASLIFNRKYKPFDIINSENNPFTMFNGKALESARPLLYYNPKFDMTEHIAYGYDINSSYANELSKKIPDTYNMRECDFVNEGEIGFNMDLNLTLVGVGGLADYVMPLIDSPYKSIIDKYYGIKKTTTDPKEKKLAKFILNCAVGLFQNHNPFVRAYVVNKANARIKKIIEKYNDIVCLSNTDSIYSIERIPELEEDIGEGLGQWKREYDGGLMRQKGVNYQKVGEEVIYRGVIKQKFKKDYNILTDKLPDCGLKYEFVNNKIQLNPNFVEEE